MNHSLNHRDRVCASNASIPLSQRTIEALGKLQTQADRSISGSFYIYDLVEQRVLCTSSSVAEMLGYSANEIHAMGPMGFASLIYPDDLDRVSEHYQKFFTLGYEETIALEYRMKQKDGMWCWLRSQETSLIQAIGGFPLQVLGFVQIIQSTCYTQPDKTYKSEPNVRAMEGDSKKNFEDLVKSISWREIGR